MSFKSLELAQTRKKLPLMSPTLIFLLEFFCVVTSWPIITNLQQERAIIVLQSYLLLLMLLNHHYLLESVVLFHHQPFIFQKLLHVHWNEYRFSISAPPLYLKVESFCEIFLKLKWHITLGHILLREARSNTDADRHSSKLRQLDASMLNFWGRRLACRVHAASITACCKTLFHHFFMSANIISGFLCIDGNRY